MRLLPLVCDVAVLVFFFHAGQLFMQLVLVQVVERPAARFCFTSCFALCLGLFYTALMNVAMASGHLAPWQHWWFAVPSSSHMMANALAPVSEEAVRNTYHWQLFHVYLGALLALLLLGCPYMLLHFAAESFLVRHRGRSYQPQLRRTMKAHMGRRWYRRLVRLVLLGVVCAAVAALYALCSGRWYAGSLAQLVAEPAPLPITSAGRQRSVDLANNEDDHRRRNPLSLALGYALRPFAKPLRRLGRAVLQHSLPMPREVPHSTSRGDASHSIATAAENEEQQQRRAGMERYSAHEAVRAAGMDTFVTLSYCLSVLTAYVAIVGVACIGFLAGYASFATPYSFITPRLYWSRRAGALQTAVHALGTRQKHILAIYAEKQRRIAQENYYALREDASDRTADATTAFTRTSKATTTSRAETSSAASATASSGALVTRLLPRWTGSLLQRTLDKARGAVSAQTRAQRIAQLAAEVDSTRYLSLAVFLQMSELDTLLGMALYGQTWVGVYYVVVGLLLAVYTLVKLAGTVVSLVLARRAAADPVTTAMQLYERLRERQAAAQAGHTGAPSSSFTGARDEVHSGLIYTLGLLLNAQMVLSSIRGLLLMLFQLTVSFGAVVTANTTAVGLAMLMGAYFVGQLVLLRQSLPTPGTGDVLHTALAPLPVYYYQRLCDCCYIAGCVLTVVVQRVVFGDPMTAVQSSIGE